VPDFVVQFEKKLDMFIDFEELFSTKFHENPFSGSRVVTFGHTERRTDRQTKLVGTVLQLSTDTESQTAMFGDCYVIKTGRQQKSVFDISYWIKNIKQQRYVCVKIVKRLPSNAQLFWPSIQMSET
jgi:hypothetical protein